MAEKRHTGGESAPEDRAEARADERREAALLEALPDGMRPLPTIHDDLSEELLALAERQVAETRKKLGEQSSKPKLKRIQELFTSKAGPPPKVSGEMEKLLASPLVVQQTAGFDASFDRAVAMALNAYDKGSVQTGASVQAAYDDWGMAVRIYKSELDAAGALLAAEIEAINHPPTQRDYDYTDSDEPVRGGAQVHHYVRAAKIGQVLLAYEKNMQKASGELATAYGELVSGLYAAVNALAVAEATLISATQTAYQVFWTSAQNAVAQARS
jgi:hypothetical protein